MLRLPIETRGRAKGMIQAGQSFSVVSRLLRCAVSTVQRLWQKFTQTGNDSILGERHLKNNRFGSLPLNAPHPWVCFKPSVLQISGQMADMVRRSRGRVTNLSPRQQDPNTPSPEQTAPSDQNCCCYNWIS